jgi:hypothetical protein
VSRKSFGIVSAAALAVGGVVAASPANAITSPTTLTLAAKASFHYTDTKPLKRENAGNSFQLSEALYQHGQKVGRSFISCVVVVAHKSDACQGAWSLPGGQITVSGRVPDSTKPGQSFNVAVTGGTGRYQNERTRTAGGHPKQRPMGKGSLSPDCVIARVPDSIQTGRVLSGFRSFRTNGLDVGRGTETEGGDDRDSLDAGPRCGPDALVPHEHIAVTAWLAKHSGATFAPRPTSSS